MVLMPSHRGAQAIDPLRTMCLASRTRFPRKSSNPMRLLLGGKPLWFHPVSSAPEGVSSSLESTFAHPRNCVNPKFEIPKVVDRIPEISPDDMTLVTKLSTVSRSVFAASRPDAVLARVSGYLTLHVETPRSGINKQT